MKVEQEKPMTQPEKQDLLGTLPFAQIYPYVSSLHDAGQRSPC